MEITITATEAMNIVQCIIQNKKVQMPVKASYWLPRYADKLEPFIKRVNALNKDLVTKYGTQVKSEFGSPVPNNPDGSPVLSLKRGDENWDVYFKEYTELLSIEETISVSQLSLSDFGDAKLSPEFFATLTKFITE